MRVARRLVELEKEHVFTQDEFTWLRHMIDDLGPISLHYIMFITGLRDGCNEEQAKMFLEPAEKGLIIGCYAQTELGHGSNLSNLEITATFDKKRGDFDFHSPTLTACKWWIGGLGIIATHALVQAKLIIDNK